MFDQVLASRNVPQPASFSTSKFVKWFLRIDESHLKPFLIRKYDRDRQIVEDKYEDQLNLNFEVDDTEEIAKKVL